VDSDEGKLGTKAFLPVDTPGVNFKTGLLAGFSEGFEEVMAVDIIKVNVFLTVSSAHDVIDGSGIFDSELARHCTGVWRLRRADSSVKLWFDPFIVQPSLEAWANMYSVSVDDYNKLISRSSRKEIERENPVPGFASCVQVIGSRQIVVFRSFFNAYIEGSYNV